MSASLLESKIKSVLNYGGVQFTLSPALKMFQVTTPEKLLKQTSEKLDKAVERLTSDGVSAEKESSGLHTLWETHILDLGEERMYITLSIV